MTIALGSLLLSNTLPKLPGSELIHVQMRLGNSEVDIYSVIRRVDYDTAWNDSIEVARQRCY
jgi:hypothetical protein